MTIYSRLLLIQPFLNITAWSFLEQDLATANKTKGPDRGNMLQNIDCPRPANDQHSNRLIMDRRKLHSHHSSEAIDRVTHSFHASHSKVEAQPQSYDCNEEPMKPKQNNCSFAEQWRTIEKEA